MTTRAAPLIFPARGSHTATVIFAHGLGDQGLGWASAVENWRRRSMLDEVKFILPNAPRIPISCNGGLRMPGWFDIQVLDGTVESLREHDDREGALQTREYLNSLVDAEMDSGIPSDRIVLGGFSQGGAIALLTGLSSSKKLGAVVGLSSWLTLSRTFKDLIPEGNPNAKTPVLICHGDEDPLVRHELGVYSAKLLTELGFDVTFKSYAGLPHSASPEELDDVEAFLAKNLPRVGSG